MDMIGASKAANKLISNPEFASSAPNITKKSDWAIQIRGAYNLLFPLMHVDFPVRDEVIKYVVSKITSAFKDHNSGNKHFGSYSIPGIDFPIMPTQIEKAILEKIVIKTYSNQNGMTSFSIKTKSPVIPDDIIVDKIGYGV